MQNLKVWLGAFRLRTLPLSLSGIILGSAIANSLGYWNTPIFILSLFTTIFLQILSNLANDLGDYLKGTDNENRVGPMRATQSGEISATQMKKAVILFSILSAISAGLLIYISAKEMSTTRILIYIGLGIAAVLAALLYTLGKKAYGYNGLGDLFVFIFFGLVSVIGVFGLYSPIFFWQILPPAIGVGLLSTAVLNLNNLRDWENDSQANKRTMVVKMGFEKARIYHSALILLACFAFMYTALWFGKNGIWLIFVLLPLLFHMKRVLEVKEPRLLDPELKKVALNTFAISVIFGLLMNLNFDIARALVGLFTA